MVFYFSTILVIASLSIRGTFLAEENKCHVKVTCGDCIQTQDCSWCSNFRQDGSPACFQSREIHDVCPKEFIETAKVSYRLVKNDPVGANKDKDPVQIRPQKVELEMTVGKEFVIDIEFRKAEDYPIDLYYIMDLSSSMAKYKNNLSKLGNKLAELMKNLTSNFQIGFGTFVDKVALPFTSTKPADLESPCKPKCAPAFSFRNNMPLNRETGKFAKEVEKAQMSGNLDTPEGVLDALLQTMVCTDAISWREKARHVLVVSTDADYHFAGDGKLGGIVEPHDGLCHLDLRGEYTHSLIYDYPSVSQISRKAVDNNMNIIFAVTSSVRDKYFDLSGIIDGSSLGLLDRSDDIAKLVAAEYQKISSRVGLTDNAQGSVFIRYSALCPEDQIWKEKNECSKMKGGSTARFRAHLLIGDCLDKSLIDQEITIKPIGINEGLTVVVRAVCDCDCANPNLTESSTSIQYNSTICSSAGDLVCGKCACNKNRIGEKCECMKNNFVEGATNTSTCTQEEGALVCSGQGECKCGVCQCRQLKNPNEKFEGKFCECDNFSCPRHEGKLCSGRGRCECKKCLCNINWGGDACDCPLGEEPCKEDPEAKVCSGRGNCVCGACHCTNEKGSRYSGKHCQICMTCLPQCETLDNCVECLSYKTGLLLEDQCKNCTDKLEHQLVDNIENLDLNETLGLGNTCVTADDSGCTFKYVYYYDEYDKLIVIAEKEKKCPKQIDIVAVALETTGGTILAGMLLLITWKVITTYHDKREYEKFEKERALASWGRGDNPLYKTAVRSYKNPAYLND